MKFLVTGGAGFIASHIVDRLIEEGNDVVVIDDLSSGYEVNINPKAKFYRMDICSSEVESIFKTEKPDYVNHHAAQTSVTRSVREPQLDVRVNILGSLNLIEQSVKYNIKKFIYASTGGAIYGEPEYLPADENHPIKPLAPYGIDKHTVEHYLYMYNVQYGLKYTILRYANVYGPRQDPHGEAGVVAIFSQKMLKDELPTIFGDGTATRDYVYVGDVVEANMLSIDKGDNGIYNIATCVETSVNELFNMLKNITGFQNHPVYKDKRPGEVQRIYLSNDKAKHELGWIPKTILKDGLKITVNFFKNRLQELAESKKEG